MKISAVSYLNTKPFLLGLEKTGLIQDINLSLDVPSKTAQKLADQQIDIGLVPVAILPQLPQYQLLTNYCIGTKGKVRTVGLYSQVPLEQVDTIWLDYQSYTSVRLVQILCKYYWKKEVLFLPAQKGFEEKIGGNSAGVIIGDRAIYWRKQFVYEYDLGLAWQEMTGLPFVFAAWVSTQKISLEWEQQLNHAFEVGMRHLDEVVQYYQPQYDQDFDIEHYLKHNIDYVLDTSKRKALSLFLNHLNKMSDDKQLKPSRVNR